ncbi:MAG: patatin-like phospholipase family protein [Bacteroidia bacterium]
MEKYKLGIALGGGAARGYAHLGVLQALKEKGIEADIYSGTSAGSVVGAFMAAGNEPEAVFTLMKRNSFFDFAKIHLPTLGLMSLDKLSIHLKKHIPYENLEDLPKPLLVTVSNLYSGKVRYIAKGPLVQAVQASSSIPVLFSPVEIEGELYVDGGVFDNLPYRPLSKICDKVIAVHICPVRPIKDLKNMIQIAARTFELSVNGNIREGRQKNRSTIAPIGIENFDLLDIKNADKLFETAYTHTRKLTLKE